MLQKTHCGALRVLALVLGCAVVPAAGSAPLIYSQGALQSPVRAGPDDLLMLAGNGLDARDTVFYQAIAGNTAVAADRGPPDGLPAISSSTAGTARIVSAAGAPYQLTVRLPPSLDAGQVYEMWVKSERGEWSNGVRINDARPLWLSPAVAYASTSIAGLPRMLKIIGRNMSAAGHDSVALRLTGPSRYALPPAMRDATLAPDSAAALDHYVTKRLLPRSMQPGHYQLQRQLAAGVWQLLPDLAIDILPDPPRRREFVVSSPAHGGCRADDGQDATVCVARAIAAANAAGGGAVVFDPGTWNLTSGALVVPAHVDLIGRGANSTRIVRHDASPSIPNDAEFILLGHNKVQGLTFSDSRSFDPNSQMRRILQLGARYNTDEKRQALPSPVSDITITQNVFDKTYGGIIDGGSSINRLFVTYNRIGDYRIGLGLGGNPYNVLARFQVTDAVIAHNQFLPGSYMDLEIRQGVIASEIGSAQRVDFSENLADGSSKEFLNSPGDPAGWRAAFFWHLHDSQEMLLISQNVINCSGDKDGDGEAISLDNNINAFALPQSQPVLEANEDSVTVRGPLKSRQNERDIDVGRFYLGHWLRIDAGPGIAQSRHITGYEIGADGARVTFTVAPNWDVVPQPAVSRVSVARTFYQTLILANTIDERKPLCLKSNRTRPKAGNISVWAQATDSVVEGNRQFDADGIVFQQYYNADDPGCAQCGAGTSVPSFLDIRGNLIEGEYDWGSACSLSGIMASYAAAPGGGDPPPLSFAVAISHNRIAHADSLYGGAINMVPTWFRGPPGYAKPLVVGMLIDHNEISDIGGAPPRSACDYVQRERSGIQLQGDRLVDATVLYGNRCERVATPLADHGAHTRRVCDQSIATCECPQ